MSNPSNVHISVYTNAGADIWFIADSESSLDRAGSAKDGDIAGKLLRRQLA